MTPNQRCSAVKRPRFGTAFSLIELIAVMVILAVLMAMTVPALQGFGEHQEARTAAASILTSMKWARQKAVTDGIPYRVEFDMDERRFRPLRRVAFAYEPIAHHDARFVQWPDPVTVELDPAMTGEWITFHPDGSSDHAIITVIGRRDTRLAIAKPNGKASFAIVNERDLEQP